MKTKHELEQRFSGFDVDEFEALFDGKNIEHVTTVATDGVLELAENCNNYFICNSRTRDCSVGEAVPERSGGMER